MNISSYQNGFVTFVDVMGWKGIWQKEIEDPLKDIIEINQIITDMAEKSESEVKRIIKSMRLDNKYDCSFQVSLISDTFVITSSYIQKSESEARGVDEKPNQRKGIISAILDSHGLILAELIVSSLKKNLMLRGATSFGSYRHIKNSFIGAAIDEAASWHETAEMVAIFMTPSAYIYMQKEKIKINKKTWEESCPQLKCKAYGTYSVNWNYSSEEFSSLAEKNSPITTDISQKYINTLNYINGKQKKKRGK
jgi:hypothetical protein